MSQRTTQTKNLRVPPVNIVRDKQYYFNTLDLEHDLLKKASDIAERMMVAFMRENKVEVSLDVDDIANRIIERIGDKLQSHAYPEFTRRQPDDINKQTFNYDDGPVIIKTEKIEIKGKIGKTSKSKDSIKESMDILQDLEI
jgi:hypothetical protein